MNESDSMSTSHNEPQARISRLLTVLSLLAAVGSLAVFTTLLLYMRGNDSNHTGWEPWLLSIFFAPTGIVGIVAFLRGSSRLGALLACCLGFGGIAFLFYIDHFNVMVQYDRWAERGMPESRVAGLGAAVMHAFEIFRWIVAFVLMLLSCLVFFVNFRILYVGLVRREHHSWIPFVGGFLGYVGMSFCPQPQIQALTVIPMVVEVVFWILAYGIGLLMWCLARLKRKRGK